MSQSRRHDGIVPLSGQLRARSLTKVGLRLPLMTTPTRVATSVRAASILYGVPGLGFGIAVPLVLAYAAWRGELPMTPFGWRLLGGPFEQIGTERLTPLGWALAAALVGVSALDVVAAIWLREGRRRGARLALATTPFSLALGAAFVLPFLLAVAPLRAILVIAGWRGLR
jgi:hypothetical protein